MSTQTVTPTKESTITYCDNPNAGVFGGRGDEDCVRDATAETQLNCIKVTSNHVGEKCITWSVNKKSIDVCVDIQPFFPVGCPSYGERPELEITHINGDPAVPNPEDEKYYVCDDAVLTIAITNYDEAFTYGRLHTSMDVTEDYPSEYAVDNEDGTITVEVGNLLEGSSEYCEISALDPTTEGQCYSELGTVTWENAEKSNTPIMGDGVIDGMGLRFEVLNSDSYGDDCTFEFEDDGGEDALVYTEIYNATTHTYYVKCEGSEGTQVGYTAVVYVRIKEPNKCWGDRGSFLVTLPQVRMIKSIHFYTKMTPYTNGSVGNCYYDPHFTHFLYMSYDDVATGDGSFISGLEFRIEVPMSSLTKREGGLCTTGGTITYPTEEERYAYVGWNDGDQGCTREQIDAMWNSTETRKYGGILGAHHDLQPDFGDPYDEVYYTRSQMRAGLLASLYAISPEDDTLTAINMDYSAPVDWFLHMDFGVPNGQMRMNINKTWATAIAENLEQILDQFSMYYIPED